MAGRGDQYIEHGGYTWRTLDGADPQGGGDGAPNDGCQRIGFVNTPRDNGEPNYLPLPPGYALAPPDADTIAVIAAHGWSTGCVVTADGGSWGSANSRTHYGTPGGRCGSNQLASSGDSHTVRYCSKRVLARCP